MKKYTKTIMKPFMVILSVLMFAVAGCGGGTSDQQPAASTGGSQPIASTGGEIVIGYNADQSGGSIAPYGVAGRYGFELAIDEINASGGILGKKIRSVILDDKADKEISKQNMEKLIFEEKALAVIGPANSANALYWLDLPQDNEVIVISHIATASEITERYAERPRNYIFRISALDMEQTRLYIAWAIRKTKNGNIAVIHDSGAYGTKAAKDVSDVLGRWGKTPVSIDTFEAGTPADDLVPLIENAKNAGADAIAFLCYPEASTELMKAMEKVEDFDPIVFGTAANAVKLWDLAGPELAGKLVFASGILPDLNEGTIKLNKVLTEKYGELPVFSTAADAYDAIYLLKAAAEKAGVAEGKAVRDALENIDDFQGAVKNYGGTFTKTNHEGLSARDFAMAHWIDGKVTKLDEDLSDLEIR